MKKQTELKVGEKSGKKDGSVRKPVKKISKKTSQKVEKKRPGEKSEKVERKISGKLLAAASTFAVCCVLLIGTAQCAGHSINKSIIHIAAPKAKPKAKPKLKAKAKRRIRVHNSAFKACQDWCRSRCDYIEIDPNQGHLYRYVCRD